MPFAAGQKLGRYEILAPIGAGGMGEVFRARDTNLGREVAVKVLPERVAGNADALQRFEREARAVAALSHSNILAIHDFGTEAGTAYAVMELLEGETLRERLGGSALPLRKAVEYAVSIANGLAAAHEKGIIHRDLKPENVFVTRDGGVKILDFGLAAHAATAAEDGASSPTLSRYTDPGVVLGTVGYMSPEQVRGLRADQRTDIFALGAVLYEMLTGRRAFQKDTAAETMTAILNEDVPEISKSGRQVPAGLERILRRCLEKNPAERLQSARDLAIALEALSGSDSAPFVAAPPARPRRALVAGLALVLPIAGAGLGYLAGQRAGHPAVGSTARPLPTHRRLSFGRGWVQAARLAPDGHTVAYAARWDGGPARVFTARLDSPRSATAVTDGSLLSVSNSGELAVLVDEAFDFLLSRGTLARLPFSGGSPRELLEDANAAAWSPDGQLAVVRTVKGGARLEFPAGKVLYESAGWLSFPRFSETGASLAFVEHPLHEDDRGWPALVELKTGSKRNVGAELTSVQGLAFAPGGHELCFAVVSGVRCRDLASGAEREVLKDTQRLVLHDIGSDGRLLATAYSLRITALAGGERAADAELPIVDGIVMDMSAAGDRILVESIDYGVWVGRPDGSPLVRLGSGIPPALSPDGKLALVIEPNVPTQLALLPTGPGETRKLPSGPLVQHTTAAFSPDGRRLVISGAEQGKASRLYVQDVASGEPQAISEPGVRLSAGTPRAVSPDGKWVLASGPDQKGALYPLEPGGAPQPVAGLEPDLVAMSWTDVPGVIFARTRGSRQRHAVYRVDVKTGRRQLWKHVGLERQTGSPFIQSIHVTPDGRRHAYTYFDLPSSLHIIGGVFAPRR